MSSKNPVYDFIPNFKDIEGKKIFTCSDSHVSHKNIVYGLSDWGNKDGCRNFSTQDGHDDCIIDGINSIVGKSDILIHCGDWTFGGKDNVKKFRDRVECENIILIFGNHDRHIRVNPELRDLFFWCGDYLELRYAHKNFIFSHYPIGSWNDMSKGSINVHGHCHGNYQAKGRQIDVCPENSYFKPYDLDIIAKNFHHLPIIKVDHH